ncbi:MAG: hypothetical protein V1798_07195 [Pseudomonadota bacterium]
MKRIGFWFVFLTLGVFFLGCTQHYGFQTAGTLTTGLTVSQTPGGDLTVAPSDTPPSIIPEVKPPDGGVNTPGDGSTEPGSEPPSDTDPPTIIPPGTEPGEGSSCATLRVIAHQVTAAWVYMNDALILGPSDIDKGDAVIVDRNIDLSEGDNTLALRIAGKPNGKLNDQGTCALEADGAQMTVQIWDCSKDPSVKVFELSVIRCTKAPQEASGTI